MFVTRIASDLAGTSCRARWRSFLTSLYPRASRLLAALAVASFVVEGLVDWLTPISLNISTIYSIPLVLAGLARSRRLLWLLLIALLCMTFAMYALESGSSQAAGGVLLQNRLLSVVTMLVTAVLMHMLIRALDALEQRDVQIRRQNEELEERHKQAERVSKQKTLLLASLSHDVRTPLSVITVTARAIGSEAQRLNVEGNIPILARQQTANAISLANLVSDILDYSAFELGRVEVHPDQCEMGALLKEVSQRLLPLAQAKRLQLSVESPLDSLYLRSDPVKLERVLTNLITNAIKYTDCGSVRVSAGYSDTGEVRVCVADTGVGIAPDDRGRIFDEFARLQPSDKRSRGWGLGLPICWRLITIMKGSISVESRPGGGSTFIVQLPRSYDGILPCQSEGIRAAPSSSDSKGLGSAPRMGDSA